MGEITIVDKTLRELNMIETIFKSQFTKKEVLTGLVYSRPRLLDSEGKGIDGRILIRYFDIFSNVELFAIQSFKKQITQRYERAANLGLLQKQLTEIREKAIKVRGYYNGAGIVSKWIKMRFGGTAFIFNALRFIRLPM